MISPPVLIAPPDPGKPVISLAEAKAHLRVRHGDDDAYITQAIADAVDYVQTLQSRVFINQTWQQATDDFDPSTIRLPFSPVSSIVAVKYSDADNVEQTLAEANYLLSADAQSPYVTWISDPALPTLYVRSDAVRINFVAGYGADASFVPPTTKRAILKFVGEFYSIRAANNAGGASLWNDAHQLLRSKARIPL